MSGNGRIDAQAALKFTSRTYQETDPAITYSAGDWTRYSWSTASGGYANWASRGGATAKLSFTGNSVAWWVNRGPYGGKAKVYVDGVQQDADPSLTGIQPVDLYSARNEPSQPAFSKSWGRRWDPHTIEIVVEGTSGRPWVDVDAFTVGNIAFCNSYPNASYCL